MQAGKLVFAQVMEFAPWTTFRESLRDIEACLEAHATQAYHLGLRGNFTRSNLAHANERCDWRLFCDFAQSLLRIARRLYSTEPFGLELDSTVYALDSTTIELCLTMFPWAPAASPLSGSDHRQIPGFLDQSFRHSRADGLFFVSQPLAGRVVQMDKAAFANQAIFRHLGERREEPSLDRRRHLCSGGDRSQAPQAGFVAAYDVASSERDAF